MSTLVELMEQTANYIINRMSPLGAVSNRFNLTVLKLYVSWKLTLNNSTVTIPAYWIKGCSLYHLLIKIHEL